MTFKEWRSLWRFDRTVDVPHLSAVLMCPWLFVRLLWFFNRCEFQAWPSEYETSLVIGWRWPFTKKFKEKKWAKLEKMPLAIYGGPMDEVYLIRATRELSLIEENYSVERKGHFLAEHPEIRHIGATVKDLLNLTPSCDHNFWLASCPQCARKALRLAIHLKTRYEPVRLIDPHEDPIVGFRRREAEAKARLEAGKSPQVCLECGALTSACRCQND
jgi:hypothetical protein